jgi:hypothetical protein
MSVQYPKNKHITLPSIEGFNSSLNILRDPPKSIHTRYIERVGDTNRILEQIDGASDRFCESILPFARGINPMVNVNYQNGGSDSGAVRFRYGAASQNQGIQSPQASLPYKVMRDGVFRPDIRPQQELLPLSRQPRLVTSQTSNPGSELVQQEIRCKPDMRALRTELLNVCAPSSKSFIIETPQDKPYNVKYAIQVVPTGSMISKPSSMVSNSTMNVNQVPTKGVQENRTYITMTANAHKNIQNAGESAGARVAVKDVLKGAKTTNASTAGTGNNIMAPPMELSRNLPRASMQTNPMSRQVNMDNESVSRNVYLPPKSALGSFCNGGTQRGMQLQQNMPTLKHPSITQTAYNLSGGRMQN